MEWPGLLRRGSRRPLLLARWACRCAGPGRGRTVPLLLSPAVERARPRTRYIQQNNGLLYLGKTWSSFSTQQAPQEQLFTTLRSFPRFQSLSLSVCVGFLRLSRTCWVINHREGLKVGLLVERLVCALVLSNMVLRGSRSKSPATPRVDHGLASCTSMIYCQSFLRFPTGPAVHCYCSHDQQRNGAGAGRVDLGNRYMLTHFTE